jgi:hypothetical protein
MYLKGRGHSEGLEDNTRIDLRETWWEVEDWMHVAQDRDQLWVLLNTVMKFSFSKRRGIS